MLLRNELIPISLNGDLRRGGYIVTGEVLGDTDAVSQGLNWIIDGKSLAAYIDPDWREAINCHVLEQPDFTFDRYGSKAQIRAGTVDNLLAGESLQDISFADVASPANSHEATSWNFGQVVTHILQFHCNYIYDADGSNGSPDGVVTTTDIDITNSTTFDLFIVRASNNLWRSLQQIGGGEEGGGEFYRIWCNRRNKIIYQPAPPFISPQPTSKGTLTKEHIRGAVRVQFHNSKPGERVGQVQIACVGGPATVFSASYPASPAAGKIFKKQQGIWANDQTRANTLAERLYKWLTRDYTIQVEVDPGLVLYGDDGNGLDLGDRLAVTFNGPTEDSDTGAGVHLNLSAESFYVYGIDVNFQQETATLTLEQDNAA